MLFLNLSPRTLENAGFSAEAVANLVIESGLQPQQVCFEITERTAAPVEVVQREAAALKECGFRIALDDVGAGNSGLELMRAIKVDFVKDRPLRPRRRPRRRLRPRRAPGNRRLRLGNWGLRHR